MSYATARRELIERLETGSVVTETPLGRIEYAAIGDGPAVLVVHGAAGGYDQGLLLARLIGGRHRFIAPSRAGYLRTPLAIGRTPAAQADAYAALLDALAIARAGVVAVSAGGPSGLAFALRHRERSAALVLVSAISQRLPTPRSLRLLRRFTLASDGLMWLLGHASLPVALAFPGLARAARAELARDALAAAAVRAVMFPLPLDQRIAGIDNDARQTQTLGEIPFERLEVPTLVVHGSADPIVPFAHGALVAGRVRGARLVAVAGGHHICLMTHRRSVVPEIEAFLAAHGGA